MAGGKHAIWYFLAHYKAPSLFATASGTPGIASAVLFSLPGDGLAKSVLGVLAKTPPQYGFGTGKVGANIAVALFSSGVLAGVGFRQCPAMRGTTRCRGTHSQPLLFVGPTSGFAGGPKRSIASGMPRRCQEFVSCDGAPAQSYATRFPRVRRRLGMERSRLHVMNRDASLKLVDFLLKRPNKAPDVCDFTIQLQKRMVADAVGALRWPADFRSMSRIGTDWWLRWLSGFASPTVERGDLLYLYNRDPQLIQQIAFFLTGMTRKTRLPPALLTKSIGQATFDEMADALCRRPMCCAQARLRHGMNFVDLCPYTIHWDPRTGFANSIEHGGDFAEVVIGLQFTQSWKPRDPSIDMECAVVDPTGRFVFELRKFFASLQAMDPSM